MFCLVQIRVKKQKKNNLLNNFMSKGRDRKQTNIVKVRLSFASMKVYYDLCKNIDCVIKYFFLSNP